MLRTCGPPSGLVLVDTSENKEGLQNRTSALSSRLTHRTPLVPWAQRIFRHCRCKMRMSCLCKLEMSAFMDGRGPHGNGAHGIESTRTGPLESVAGSKTRAFNAERSGKTDRSVRPSGASAVAAAARARRPGGDPRITRTALEPQIRGQLRAEGSGPDRPTLCGFRAHAGGRALGQGRVGSEPGDGAEVDDPGSLLVSPLPAGEKDPRMAGAPGQFRGAGDAG